MAAFLASFKILCFHTTSFPRAPPSKTVSSRNNMAPLIGLLIEEDNVSDLYSSFYDKNGLTMAVGRGSQVGDRIFKEQTKGI